MGKNCFKYSTSDNYLQSNDSRMYLIGNIKELKESKYSSDNMLFIGTLYSELKKEGRLHLAKSRSNAYYLFNSNVSRAITLLTLTYGPNSDDDWALLDTSFLHQTALTQTITSLETYYQYIFQTIAENIKTSEVSAIALSRFLKKNRLLNEFANALENKKNINFYISELIPEFFSFQQKDRIKISLRLIDLDPIGQFDKEWERTFSDAEKSTINLRHISVHEGVDFNKIFEIDLDFVIERIKDAIVLINNIENQINEKYPIEKLKELYPKSD